MPKRQVKKHPKTTGYTVTHSCGHEGKHRTYLMWYAGVTRTPETEKGVAKIIKEAQDVLEPMPCPNCRANNEYTRTRKGLAEIFDAISLTIPEELKGTIRQRAWGESVRTEAIMHLVNNISFNVLYPHTNTLFLGYLLNPGSRETSDEVRACATKLRKVIRSGPDYQYLFRDEHMGDDLVAVVLIALRDALRKSHRLASRMDAKTWMMVSRRGIGVSPQVSNAYGDPNLILRAHVALGLCPQGSIEELDAMMHFLGTRQTGSDRASFLSLSEQGTKALDIAEMIQVERALTRPAPGNDPF